jgi:GGDEF domain-containing protein
MGATSMFLGDKQMSKQIMKRADTAMYTAKKKTQWIIRIINSKCVVD